MNTAYKKGIAAPIKDFSNPLYADPSRRATGLRYAPTSDRLPSHFALPPKLASSIQY